jgi:hypothetical protein
MTMQNCKEKTDEQEKKTRYLILADLTDCVSRLEDFARRCECIAEIARELARGFRLGQPAA